jgi:hypothetical protein
MDKEAFESYAYNYRSWPGKQQAEVVARFNELVEYVEGLITAEREACAKACEVVRDESGPVGRWTVGEGCWEAECKGVFYGADYCAKAIRG